MNSCNSFDISVLVAVHNVEDYLEECLESLHSQVNVNAEFIVVNDGSTDSCGQICDAYQTRDERFHIIHLSENKGLMLARKTGIENACGRYIVFLDGDDSLSSPESLYELVREMDSADCDIGGYPVGVFGNDTASCESMQKFLAYERASTYTSSLDILRAIYSEQRVMSWNIWNKCYRSCVLKDCVSFIPEEHVVMAEDALLVFLFATCSKNFKVLNTGSIINYRLGSGVSTRRHLTADQFRPIAKSLRVIRFLNEIALKKSLSADYLQLIQATLIHLLRHTLHIWNQLTNEHKSKAFEYVLQEGFYKETLYIISEMFADKDDSLFAIMEGTASFINTPLQKRRKSVRPKYKRVAYGVRDFIRIMRRRS